MKLLFLLLLGASAVAAAGAGELILAERGRPGVYSIVFTPGDQSAKEAAVVLQKYLKQSTGVELPLRSDRSRTPAIFVGNSPEKLHRGEFRLKAKEGNLYIYGDDTPGSGISGSLKGVVTLLEKFADFVVFAPGESGAKAPPRDRIAVPDDLNRCGVPAVEFNVTVGEARETGPLYETANNMFRAPWYSFSGGHTHWIAMPKELYRSHPEYFALVKGKRMEPHKLNWHSQYCYSSSEVRERIYRNTLSRLKQKHSLIEVGQNDGFVPCECPRCAGSSSGQRLWEMHLGMAERWSKAVPGKRVNIIAYGPTAAPPVDIAEFPPNVMVNLAPCTKESVVAWSKLKVPGGFSGYLYNWGWYQLEGFMPKLSFRALQDQAGLFRANHIIGFYRCGFGELFGLEGPAYYIWGKLLENPDCSVDLLLARYCRAAFDSAAPEMIRFYTLLDDRMQYDLPRSFEWYKPELLADKTPALIETARLMSMRYPTETVEKLENLLRGAERKSGDSTLLKLVRTEFDYLKLTVAVTHAFDQLRRTRGESDWQKLLTALEGRRDFLLTLPLREVRGEKRIAERDGFPLFGRPALNELLEGGRLLGRLRAPFNWNPSDWKKRDIRPVGRSISADGSSQQLVQRNFTTPDPRIDRFPCRVSVSGTPENLTVTFHNPGSPAAELDNAEFYIYLGSGERRIRFAGRPRNATMREYLRVKTNAENGGDGDLYHQTGRSVPLKRQGENVTATLDLRKLELDGEELDFNVSRLGAAWYVWEYNLDQKSYKNCNDTCGKLRVSK